MTKQELTSQIDAIANTIENLPDYSTLKRAELIEAAKSHFLKIEGKTPNKNNTVAQLLEVLNLHKHNARVTLQNKLETLQSEIAAIIDAETAQEQEQTASAPSETDVLEVITFDLIDGYRKLATPYILKIVAPENSNPAAVEIYFKGELIDSAKNQKGARQKAARHAGPMDIPEGYTIEAATINDEIVSYTAMYKGEQLTKKGGEIATFTTKLSNARGRAVKVIARHYKESQESAAE